MIFVTSHAADRYIERVDGSLTWQQAVAAIQSHEAAIKRAAAFGCRTVRIGNGAKLILDGGRVVTVLAKGYSSRSWMASFAERGLA